MRCCIECGFLAVRDEYNETVCEATDHTRTKGYHKSSMGNSTNANVFCYMDSSHFAPPDDKRVRRGEAGGSIPLNTWDDRNSTLRRPNECQAFCKWLPGKDPKEHQEMSYVEQMQAQTQQWREVIAAFTNDLIDEGTRLRSTEFERKTSSFTSDVFVELQAFQKWRTSCKLLLLQLGTFSEPWSSILDSDAAMNNLGTVMAMTGALESILDNISQGRLSSLEDIVFAEAFANLTEQGEHLLERSYFLAAGVIFRAVLEERIRRMCELHNQMPSKERPTIADYNQALYKAKVYDKITFKNVEAMTAVGNSAAHNSGDLAIEHVKQFQRNLIEFLTKFSTI